MQGVDRLDQLRTRFSISDSQTFQRWHIKLAMAFIDIGRCNAYSTRKIANKENIKHQRDPHRIFIMELINEFLHGTWKNAPSGIVFCGDATESAAVLTPGFMSPSSKKMKLRKIKVGVSP